jgi:putative oxidoreductase
MRPEARLFIPALQTAYSAIEPWAYAFLRLTAGAIIATSGYGKLFSGGVTRDIELFHRLGIEPAVILAYFTSGLEFFGGILIVVGLLARPIAAMFVVELLVIFFMVMVPRGSGYQLTVVWLGVFFFILARGGGRISIDRMLGWEF